MRTLNRNEPYGTIHGAQGWDACYEQDGVMFDGQGRQCGSDGKTLNGATPPPIDMPFIMPDPPPETGPELPAPAVNEPPGEWVTLPKPGALALCSADDEGAIRVIDLTWQQVRGLAITHAGATKSTNLQQARELLDEAGITHVRPPDVVA